MRSVNFREKALQPLLRHYSLQRKGTTATIQIFRSSLMSLADEELSIFEDQVR